MTTGPPGADRAVELRPGRYSLDDPSSGLRGHLVVDSLRGGLCAGGLRMWPDVSEPVLARLARLMTLKFGIMALPIGGAKAGVVADPRAPGSRELLAAAGRALRPWLERCYVMGEDLGTRAEDVLTVYRHASVEPASLMPDGAAAAGPALRRAGPVVAGWGVAEAARTAAMTLGLPVESLRASVQGFGTVGGAAAGRLQRLGVRVVAVADAQGTLYQPSGLDVDELRQAVDNGGVIDRARVPARVARLRANDWCQLPAELLVPAAVENAITVETLPRVTRSARLVVEGANSPVTEEAERRLEESGVAVVPDFVANAGSAAALGLVVQGLAASEQALVAEVCRRIARATAAVVAGTGTGARQRAEQLSERLAATATGG